MEKIDYTIGGIGYVLVECESRYENRTGFIGVDSKELIIDTRYEPLKYVKTFGKVVQVPFALGERPIRQIPVGMPGYGARNGDRIEDAHAALYSIGGVYKYKRLSDIAPEVKIGDTIWFNRTVLHRTENIVDEFERDGAKVFTFRVDYDLIICIEKENPIMIGGWCFLQPLYENWAKQFIPTFHQNLGPNGEKIAKPKDQWIVLAAQPPQEKLRAILKYCGTPLKGDENPYSSGAEVFIRRQVQWKYKYKSEEFMLIHYWDIFAEVINVEDESEV